MKEYDLALQQKQPLNSNRVLGLDSILNIVIRKWSEEKHIETITIYAFFFTQHTAKKPKIMKQLQDNAFDSMVQMTGSIPSPALSQMSNMSNTKRFIKLIGGRERGRKNKSMKALVALVHDMGPNWELISDAINSTGQFKFSLFRW
uniref:Uncharacterized protein n=1 Tax=Salix viminalis TaxID=40686 RepID=A0A6N2MFD0_SALVM